MVKCSEPICKDFLPNKTIPYPKSLHAQSLTMETENDGSQKESSFPAPENLRSHAKLQGFISLLSDNLNLSMLPAPFFSPKEIPSVFQKTFGKHPCHPTSPPIIPIPSFPIPRTKSFHSHQSWQHKLKEVCQRSTMFLPPR